MDKKERLLKTIIESNPEDWAYDTTRNFRGFICAETITLKSPDGDRVNIWFWNEKCAIDLETHLYCGKVVYKLGYPYEDYDISEKILKVEFDRMKKHCIQHQQYIEKSDTKVGFFKRRYISLMKYLQKQ